MEAVLELTARFDRIELTAETVAFSKAEIDDAVAAVPPAERAALELAAARIRAYHERQCPRTRAGPTRPARRSAGAGRRSARPGSTCRAGWPAIPSSVLMNAIPAQVAGVERLVICAPTPDGTANPLVLLAARLGRRRDGLSHRRRAGDRGAGLRRGADPARRQDHRAPATPMSPRPSGRSSARSAST